MNRQLLAVLVLCLHIQGMAQTNAEFLKEIFIGKTNDTLPYRLLEPLSAEPGKKYPLVIFLHGSGERGSDNEKQLIHLPITLVSEEGRKNFPCYIIFPQCPETDKWVDYGGQTKSLKNQQQTQASLLTFHLIDELVEKLNIDKSRIYITGLSLGGMGTFDMISRRPGFFAAAVPVCGIGDTSKAAVIKDIPMWVFHGDQDMVVKVKYSRMIVEAVKKAGGNPKYTEYEGVGHDSWVKAYREPELVPWMFSQKLK